MRGKKCKDKDISLAYGEWIKVGQDFTFHLIISAHYTF